MKRSVEALERKITYLEMVKSGIDCDLRLSEIDFAIENAEIEIDLLKGEVR